MRKYVLALLLVFFFSSLSIAQIGKYRIIPEKRGLFGIGSRPMIMLDSESGKSWEYSDHKWNPLTKIEEVKPLTEEEIRAKIEQELKAKQEEEQKAKAAEQPKPVGKRKKAETKVEPGTERPGWLDNE